MIRPACHRLSQIVLSLALLAVMAVSPVLAQRGGGDGANGPLPSIEEKTTGMEQMDGFLPLYWDSELGQLWMEIPRLNEEMIHFAGYKQNPIARG